MMRKSDQQLCSDQEGKPFYCGSKTSTRRVREFFLLGAFLSLCAVAITPLFFGNEWTKENGYIVLLVYSLIGTATLAKYRNLTVFVVPTSLIFLYVSWSMTIGAWGHSISAVLSQQQYENFLALQKIDEALVIFMLTLAVLIPLSRLFSRPNNLAYKAIKFPPKPLFISILLLASFLFITIDLSPLGGSGTLNNIPKALLSISVIILFANMRGTPRYFFYILLIALNASVASFNKREAIFLIFVVLFLEAYNGRLRGNSSLLIKAFLTLIAIVALVLGMSIYRGYGDYEVDNFISAFRYIVPYVSSEFFLAWFLNNIEANYFFFHAVNSIEMILLNPENITFGSTLIKFLFLPFPRELFPWKPDSAIHLYTMAYDPQYRALGGSWPINIVSELIWNFWLLAPIGAALLTWLFSRLETAIVTTRLKQHSLTMVFYLFVYMNSITLARGSGLDQYLFELIIAYVFVLFIRITVSLLGLPSATGSQLKFFRK